MVYAQKYFDKDYMSALATDDWRTAGYVCKRVGCSRPKAIDALNILACEKKIEMMTINAKRTKVFRLRD